MRELLVPYKFQNDIIERSSRERHFAFLMDMGCISGDTEIRINRSGAAKKIKIKTLYKNLQSWKLSSPLKIRSFKKDHIGLHNIVNVIYSGRKETYKLKLSCGRSLRLTSDHEVLTDKGFIRLDELEIGAYVMVDRYVRPVKSRKQKAKPKNYLYVIVYNHPYAKQRGKKLQERGLDKGYGYVARHRLVAEAEINKLSYETYLDKLRIGKVKGLKFLDPQVWAVHHKDHTHRNDSLKNLEVMTHEQHVKLHALESKKNFKQGRISYSKVKSIDYYGEEDVYDIKCFAPHKNFVANNIVIHNCGKTLTSINWLKNKWREHGGLIDTIVLCPIIALDNWKNEFMLNTQLAPELIGVVKSKDMKKRLKVINDPRHKIIVINYEALLSGFSSDTKKTPHTGVAKALIDRGFGCAIGDEIHRIKNHKGKTHKAALAITKGCQHRAILTGTPITNSILDVYAQFYFMDRGETFGASFTEFRKYYCEDENADWASKESYFPKWVVRPYMIPEFKKKLEGVSARVTTEEAVELPEYQAIQVPIELSKEQLEHYHNLKTQLVTWLQDQPDNPVIVKNALVKILRLNQITTGVMKLEDETIHRFKENPKLDAALELIEDMEGHKVIILAVYKEDFRVIGEALTKRGIKYAEIHGGIDTEGKLAAAKSFERPEIGEDDPTVLIGHPKAMIAVNLVGAKYKIYFSRDFSLEAYLQSLKRNLRNGAIKFHSKLVDYHLITLDTTDNKIFDSVMSKKNFSDDVLDAGRLLKMELESEGLRSKKELEDFLK